VGAAKEDENGHDNEHQVFSRSDSTIGVSRFLEPNRELKLSVDDSREAIFLLHHFAGNIDAFFKLANPKSRLRIRTHFSLTFSQHLTDYSKDNRIWL
jgi:hypothetical protein